MKISIIFLSILLFTGSCVKAEKNTQKMNNTEVITVDFYHDVICSWCYVISPRLRKLEKENKNIKVKHHSFALFPNKESIIHMFGSKKEGKKQIMEHWRNSSCRLDEEVCKIDANLMEDKTFDYPHSMPGLIACKAAEKQGGSKMYWDFYDAVQKAHLVEGKNIDSEETLIGIAEVLHLDIELFKKEISSSEIREIVNEEIKNAQEIGINSVPTIVVNGKYKISGARSYDELKQAINRMVN